MGFVSSDTPDPVEAIAGALARLRGGRRGPRGPQARFRHPNGAGHDGHGGPHRLHDGFGPGGEGRRGAGPRPWIEGAAGMRMGPPAIVRMLEALAAASNPLSVSAIGDAIGVDQPRASRLVQQGAAHGLVQREADPDDARRTRIALTEEGHRLARGFRSDRRETLGRALEEFTEEERRELARLLGKLADHWPG